LGVDFVSGFNFEVQESDVTVSQVLAGTLAEARGSLAMKDRAQQPNPVKNYTVSIRCVKPDIFKVRYPLVWGTAGVRSVGRFGETSEGEVLVTNRPMRWPYQHLFESRKRRKFTPEIQVAVEGCLREGVQSRASHRTDTSQRRKT
jgi:hypothetical protein